MRLLMASTKSPVKGMSEEMNLMVTGPNGSIKGYIKEACLVASGIAESYHMR